MKKFSEWVEDNKKKLWIDLYLHLLEADHIHPEKGMYKDERYHDNLIKKLRILGLGEEANELEMVRISQDDIDFSNSDLDSSKKDYHQKKTSARLAYNTYMDHIEDLTKKISKHISEMGWQKDSEIEFDKRFPHTKIDHGYYDL